MTRLALYAAALALLAPTWALPGCVVDEELGSRQAALGTSGRWIVPADVLADGDRQNNVEYTGAGPWLGEESCTDGLEPGAVALRDYLYEYFPQVPTIGGFACRAINGDPSQASVHSTGRALDIHIPLTADEGADNDLGDPIAHWLIRNADAIGIQFIIWDLTTWAPFRDAGDKSAPYGGAHPHDDHLHIELSLEAAALGTPWFDEDWVDPEIVECQALPPEGGEIDERDACALVMGPSRFWRYVEGEGQSNSLFWTNAVQAEEQSNWARWNTKMSEAGDYELEVFIDPDYAVHQRTRYELSHAGRSSEILVDQGAADGWHSLGTFSFEAGSGQHLSLYDNNIDAVADEQRITADAIRLTRVGDCSSCGLDGGCGCQSSGDGGWASTLFLLGLLAFVLRRRRGVGS